MAADLEHFITEQKSKLAKERQDLEQHNTEEFFKQEPATNGYHDNRRKENIPPARQSEQPPVAVASRLGQARPLPSGSYENKRKNLRDERNREYNVYLAEKKLASNRQAVPGDGNSLPLRDRDSAKTRAKSQRNQEYNEYLRVQQEEKQRRVGLALPIGQGPAPLPKPLPGQHEPPLPLNRDTEREERGQDRDEGHRDGFTQTPLPPESRDRDPRDRDPRDRDPRDRDPRDRDPWDRDPRDRDPRDRDYRDRDYRDRDPRDRDPRDRYNDQYGNYDDILRRKREDEARYRRFNDDVYNSGGLKPARSDPYLNDQGREVRFRQDGDTQRRSLPPPNVVEDRSWLNNIQDPGQDQPRLLVPRDSNPRQRSFYEDRPRDGISAQRSRSAPPDEEGIFVVGARTEADQQKRKKEAYRKELEQQMREGQILKQRDRENEMMGKITGEKQLPKPAGILRNKPSSYAVGQQQQRGRQYGSGGGYGNSSYRAAEPSSYQPSAYQNPSPYQRPSAYPAAAEVDPTAVRSAIRARLNQSLDNLPPAHSGSGLAPSSLGLSNAYAKSQPSALDQPLNLDSFPSGQLNYNDPYVYYGMRDPLDPANSQSVEREEMTKFVSAYLLEKQRNQPSSSGKTAQAQQPTPEMLSEAKTAYEVFKSFLAQQQEQPQSSSRPAAPSQRGGVAATSEYNKAAAAALKSQSTIQNFVGEASPRSKTGQQSYAAQLQMQIQEKQAKKKKEKEDQERYELKMEAEAKNYDPYGKGGGGAPMKDVKGNIVADLKQLHNLNELKLTDPQQAEHQLKLYSQLPLNSGDPSLTAPVNPAAAAAAAAASSSAAAATFTATDFNRPQYGRGKIFSEDQPTTEQLTQKDSYKGFLAQQIEEKRKRESQHKDMLRQEEERENRRIEDERKKMQEEYESDRLRQKKKEDETRLKLEQQMKEAEDKKKVLEQKRKEEEGKRLDELREQQQREIRERQSTSYRTDSPPIPTLRGKDEPPPQKSDSPPVPALRSKAADSEPAEQRAAPPLERERRADDDTIQQKINEIIKQREKIDKYADQIEQRKEAYERSKQKTEFEEKAAELEGRKERTKNFDVVAWLRNIDPDMVFYAKDFVRDGYQTINTLKRLTRATAMQVAPDMKLGHLEALMFEIDKLNGKVKQHQHSSTQQIYAHMHRMDDEDAISDSGSIVLEDRHKGSEMREKLTTEEKIEKMGLLDQRKPKEEKFEEPKVVYIKKSKKKSKDQNEEEVDRSTPVSNAMSASPDGYHESYADFLSGMSKKSETNHQKARQFKRPARVVHSRKQTPGEEDEQGRSLSQASQGTDVIRALSAMKRQLHDEQKRVQNQLEKREYNAYDPVPDAKHTRYRTPPMEVFNMAVKKESVRPRRTPSEANVANLNDFNELRNKGNTGSRQDLRSKYPNNPHSGSGLEAQQSALIKEQQKKLTAIRAALTEGSKKSTEKEMGRLAPKDIGLFRDSNSPGIPLPSDSAFVNVSTGEAELPPSPTRRNRYVRTPSPQFSTSNYDPLGSVASFDVDSVKKRNNDRLRKLKNMKEVAENDSGGEPDDILKNFMSRKSLERK